MFHATGIRGYGRGRCARGPQVQVSQGTGATGLRAPMPMVSHLPRRDSETTELDRGEEIRMLEEEELMLKQELDDMAETIEDLRTNNEKEVKK